MWRGGCDCMIDGQMWDGDLSEEGGGQREVSI